MNNENIMVSVICLAFNHEKYIARALEGFVSQKTSFKYEVFVHDDASIDGTRSIIEEYAQNYPSIIKPIYQAENQYSKKVKITKTYISPLVNGKYIAYCEGDDYWTDCNKLQEQFDIMECHPECSMCTHTVQRVLEDGSDAKGCHPSIPMKEGRLGIQAFLDIQSKYPFQTSCFFIRKTFWLDFIMNPPEFRLVSKVGDEPMLLYMVSKGDIYYLNKMMSSYRTMSVGSWSARQRNDPQKRIERAKWMYQMMCMYDSFTDHQYDCHLLKYKCILLRFEGKYKEIIKRENREYIKELSLLKRIYIYVCAIFPFVQKIFKVK